jgi:hypothetical protein
VGDHVEADIDQIRQTGRQIFGRAKDLYDSPLLQSSWELPLVQQRGPYTGQVSSSGVAGQSGLPAARGFWGVGGAHDKLFTMLRIFQQKSTSSLQAIGVAYAAAANAYETTDTLSAGDITRRVFVYKPERMSEEEWRKSPEYRKSLDHVIKQEEKKQAAEEKKKQAAR